MKRLHTFILKSFIGPLIATFFVSLFILLMQFLWRYIDDLAGKGLEWTIIAELIIYASARLIPMALPLAILLSSIMTFGNLGENFELTAVKSAGISLQRFMKPLIFLTFFISIGAFYYSDYIIPYTNLKTGALIYSVKNQRPELQIKEGVFYNGIDGISIKIAEKNYKTNLLKNIMVYDHGDNKDNKKVTIADSGYMRMTSDEKHLIFTLYNGHTYEEFDEKRKKRPQEKEYPHQTQKFEKQVITFELTGLDFSRTDEELFKNNFQMFNLSQLEYAEDSLKEVLDTRVKNFSKSLTKTEYFKREHAMLKEYSKDKNKKIKERTLKKKKNREKEPVAIEKNTTTEKVSKKDSSQFYFSSDSIYHSLNNTDKDHALQYALNYARSAHNNISNNKKQFNHRAERIRRHQIEWHRKFSLSFACLVFFFIGAPFGAIVRKGGFGTPVVVSVLFFILYYIISITGEKFAREGVVPAYIGMWLSSFILMPLGVFLTYKATTDSVILNSDTYLLFFKRIFKRFSKKSDE